MVTVELDDYVRDALGAFADAVLDGSEEYGDDVDVRLGDDHYDSLDVLRDDLPTDPEAEYAGFVDQEALEEVAGDDTAAVTKVVGPDVYQSEQAASDAVDEMGWTGYLLDHAVQSDSAGSTEFQSYDPFLTVDADGDYTALLVSAQREHVPCMGSRMSLPHVVYAVHGTADTVPDDLGDLDVTGDGPEPGTDHASTVPETGPDQRATGQERQDDETLPDQLQELEGFSDVMPKITNFEELGYAEQRDVMDRAAEGIEQMEEALAAYDGFTNAWIETRAWEMTQPEDGDGPDPVGLDDADLDRYRDRFADAVADLAEAEPGDADPMAVMEEIFLSSIATQALTDAEGFREQYRQDRPDSHDTVFRHGRRHRQLDRSPLMDLIAPSMDPEDGDVADLGQMMREVAADGPDALDSHFEAYQDQLERQQRVQDQREKRNSEVIYQ